MENLKDFDFESKIEDMVYEFGGVQDSEAICNIIIDKRRVQVTISLIDEDESDFSEYEGIPTIEL